MLNHFAAEWKTKTGEICLCVLLTGNRYNVLLPFIKVIELPGLDILSNHKAKLRLLVAIDKVILKLFNLRSQEETSPKMIQFDRELSVRHSRLQFPEDSRLIVNRASFISNRI